MKKLNLSAASLILLCSLATTSLAKNTIHHQHLLGSTPSGVSIKNVGGSTTTVTSVYIANLYSNTDCNSGQLVASYGNPYGAIWTKINIAAGVTKDIGGDYLYNMIMRYLFDAYGENPGALTLATPGNGTASNNTWCMVIGITNQVVGSSPLTCTLCSLLPANILVNSAGNAVTISNIQCSDATRTCTQTSSSGTNAQQTFG